MILCCACAHDRRGRDGGKKVGDKGLVVWLKWWLVGRAVQRFRGLSEIDCKSVDGFLKGFMLAGCNCNILRYFIEN